MTEVKLFELGKVFTSTGATTQPIERNRLAGVLCGNRHGYASPLHFKEEKVDFLDAKGAVEFILGQMRLNLPAGPTSIGFDLPGDDDREPFVVPGETLQLRLGETILGSVGRIRPEILRGFDIKLDVYYFDLDFDALCGLVAAPNRSPRCRYTPPSSATSPSWCPVPWPQAIWSTRYAPAATP